MYVGWEEDVHTDIARDGELHEVFQLEKTMHRLEKRTCVLLLCPCAFTMITDGTMNNKILIYHVLSHSSKVPGLSL
jgi:hypothetical protein